MMYVYDTCTGHIHRLNGCLLTVLVFEIWLNMCILYEILMKMSRQAWSTCFSSFQLEYFTHILEQVSRKVFQTKFIRVWVNVSQIDPVSSILAYKATKPAEIIFTYRQKSFWLFFIAYTELVVNCKGPNRKVVAGFSYESTCIGILAICDEFRTRHFSDYQPFSESLLTKEYLKSCLGKYA